MILQFFVDFLSKKYEVATQDLELLETLDHIEELKDLLLEIYQSVRKCFPLVRIFVEFI